MIYITLQGDTFDLISKKCYGTEGNMSAIMTANPDQMGVMVFGAGVSLQIPKVSENQLTDNTLPPWRQTE